MLARVLVMAVWTAGLLAGWAQAPLGPAPTVRPAAPLRRAVPAQVVPGAARADPAPRAPLAPDEAAAGPGAGATPAGETTPAPGHETEEETIAKCLRDLASQDPADRRRAALIIGKYTDLRAQQAVMRCLRDPDDQVRQSALVSLSEQRFVPPAARPAIVRLVVDPNVHVRRIASALLRDVYGFGGLGLGGLGLVGPPGSGGVAVAGADDGEGPHDPDSAAFLNQAVNDPDAIVRKNVLSLHPYMRGVFQRPVLTACLQDPDREIRVLALQACASTLPPPDLPGLFEPLATDPEPSVREELARCLGRFGRLPEGDALLATLLVDSAASVRAQAAMALARTRNPEARPALEAFLSDERNPAEDRRRMVPYLPTWGEAGTGLLVRLAGETTPLPLRVAAVQALAGCPPSPRAPLSLFTGLLAHPSKDMRTAALSVLSGRLQDLSPQDLLALCQSPYPDVRQTGVNLVVLLPPDLAAGPLTDLLLDESVEVRCAAITQIGVRTPTGWLDVLRQSLKDPEPDVQRTAVMALLRRPTDADCRAVLQEYLPRCRDPELVRYLQAALARPAPRVGAPTGGALAVPVTPRGPLRAPAVPPRTVPAPRAPTPTPAPVPVQP